MELTHTAQTRHKYYRPQLQLIGVNSLRPHAGRSMRYHGYRIVYIMLLMQLDAAVGFRTASKQQIDLLGVWLLK